MFMDPKKFAMVGGGVMLAMGVLALAFPGVGQTLPVLNLENSYGLFVGIFPMNVLNKVALILFGVVGIAVASSKFRSLPLSILYSRVVMVAMGALAILGMIPQTNTLFGYWPLFGNEIWAHALFAVLGGVFGFALSAKAAAEAPKVRARTEYTTPLTHGR